MSSSEQRAQSSDHPASLSEARNDAQAKQPRPESVSSAGEHMNQQTDSTVEKVASQAPQPPERPERPTPSASSPPVGEPQETASGADMSDVSDTSKSNPSKMDDSKETDVFRQLPIPPASEPMQYRAIGLIRGKYMPSEEQFTRGNLLTDDGTEVDAVLLGRVMSLVKKHIELDEPHLWVVYPRTRNKDSQLHAQIVGVWEPEKLNRDDDEMGESDDLVEADSGQAKKDETAENAEASAVAEAKTVASDASAEAIATESAESTDSAEESSETAESDAEVAAPDSAKEAIASSQADASADAAHASSGDSSEQSTADLLPAPRPPKAPAAPMAAPAPTTKPDGAAEMLNDGYFSIRGEIVKCSPEENQLTVKIRQAPRKADDQPKAFNLLLQGMLEGRTTGYFWELDVQREGNNLVVQEGTMIRMVPPSKTKRRSGPRDGRRRSDGGSRPYNSGPKRPPNRSTPKPTIRKKSAPSKPPEESPSSESQE